MSGTAFSITPVEDGVRVAGTIDVGNAPRVLREGDAAIAAAKQPVVDVSTLASADSVTLAVLVAWSAHAAKAGRPLAFRGLPERLRALAHLSDAEGLLGLA